MKRQRYPKNFKEQLVKEAKGKSVTLFQLPSDTKLTPKPYTAGFKNPNIKPGGKQMQMPGR